MKKLLFLILFVSFFVISAFGQKTIVTGSVKNSNGEPMAAVVVTEKGVTNTTLTDSEGRYRIEVQPNAVIEFSMLGYKNNTFKTSSSPSNTIDIILIKKKYVKLGAFGGMNMSVDGLFVFSDLHDKINNHNIKPCYGYYNAGIYIDVVSLRTFSSEFGIWFSSRGIKEEFDSYKGVSQFYYVSIPVPMLAKFKFRSGKTGIYGLCGFVCDIFLKGDVKETYYEKERSINISNNIVSPVSPGFLCGLGYETKIGFGIRLDYNAWTVFNKPNYCLMHNFNASLTYTIPRKKDKM